MVRASGYLKTLDDFRAIPLVSRAGIPVRLGDVATLQIGPEMRRGIAELDGEGEVAGGVVVLRSGKNAQETIKAVKAKLSELQSSLPQGVEIVTTYDRSALIERAIQNLTTKLVEEFIVVAVESSAAALIFETPTLAEYGANFLPVVYCGVMSSGAGYTLQILGQKELNPAIASLIMCLESVFSALGGWLLLHQSLSMREVFGCTLIFAAVVLAQLPVEDWLKCRSASRK